MRTGASSPRAPGEKHACGAVQKYRSGRGESPRHRAEAKGAEAYGAKEKLFSREGARGESGGSHAENRVETMKNLESAFYNKMRSLN